MRDFPVTIFVNHFWRRVEPDGVKCLVCEEVAWISPVQLFTQIGSLPEEPAAGAVICQSCAALAEIP